MIDFTDFTLGLTSRIVILDNQKDYLNATLSLIEQAKFSVKILSQDLDPNIFNTAEFSECLVNFIKKNSRSKVHILVQHTLPLLSFNPNLVELSRRLHTSLEIRKIHDDNLHLQECFMLVDNTGIIWQEQYQQPTAIVNFSAQTQAHTKNELYQKIWDISTSDPHLRRLIL